MDVKFDKYDRVEKREVILKNINDEVMYKLPLKDIPITERLGGYSEVSFTVSKIINGNKSKYYDYIICDRYIEIEGIGVFVITEANESKSPNNSFKDVKAVSNEYELVRIPMPYIKDTLKLYDLVKPQDTILGKIASVIPTWSIGYVSVDLMNDNLKRTFEVEGQNNTQVYAFMMGELSQAFKCLFTFDTFNRRINCYSQEDFLKEPNCMMSYDSLIKEVTISPNIDDLITALDCYGGNGLDISDVNPLGGNTIYNFAYYLDGEDIMSSNLKGKVIQWMNDQKTQQATYGNLLVQIKNKMTEKSKLDGDLTKLNTEKKIIEDSIAIKNQGGLDASTEVNNLANKESEIKAKQTEITNKQAEIDKLKNDKKGINDTLSIKNYFTVDEQKELFKYTKKGTYNTDKIIITESMTDVQVQEQSQKLFDESVKELNKSSQPVYNFSLTPINFPMIKVFKNQTKNLNLGSCFAVVLEDKFDTIIFKPVILEMSYLINPVEISDDLSLAFSTNLYDKNGMNLWHEILNKTNTTSNQVSVNKDKWGSFEEGGKSRLDELYDGVMDAAVRELVNGDKQTFIADRNGVILRKLEDDGTYSPKQIRMINNMIGLTDNNFGTLGVAIGDISFNGSKYYGIAANLLIGKQVISEQLIVENQSNTFRVDGTGATMTNGIISVEKKNGNEILSKILLDPNNGFKIQSKGTGDTILTDKVWLDLDGNVNFKGNLQGAKGTFSGLLSAGEININNNFKVDKTGVCTATDINISGGGINIGGDFTVDSRGNCTTNSITINGGRFKAGTIEGAAISGGEINVTSDIYVGRNIIMQGDNIASILQMQSDVALIGYRGTLNIQAPGGLTVNGETLSSRATFG